MALIGKDDLLGDGRQAAEREAGPWGGSDDGAIRRCRPRRNDECGQRGQRDYERADDRQPAPDLVLPGSGSDFLPSGRRVDVGAGTGFGQDRAKVLNLHH